jgi:CO/xanthine dehydrogenase Mo-binding subunit
MKVRGRGIAVMFYPVGFTSYPNPGAAFIKVNQDGSAILYIGTTDLGQGSATVLSQIAAEELGIEYDKISVVSADTLVTPFDLGTVASRVTYIVGNAVQRTARAAKKILLEVAAEELKIAAEALEAQDGVIFVKGFPERRISLAKIAWKAYMDKGRPIIAADSYNPSTTMLDKETGHGKPYGAYVFGAQIAEVEVDTETGQFDVLRIIAVHDCGKSINPLLTEGQIEGGAAMGLGFGIMEEMVIEGCKVKNPELTNYIVPTSLDVPDIVSGIVERAESTGPFGAKGIGEPSLLPTAPAIVNAIQNAVGIRLRELPVTPEKILMAIREKSECECAK